MSAVDQAAPQLLPCPFCGGPAAFRGAAIRCTSFACNTSMSPVWTTAEIRKAKGDHAEKLRISIEQTAERWNRREAADMAECAAFFAGYEAGEADGRADLAAPSAQPVRFGAGNWVVVTGTFNECPALFIEPSKTPGKVGESAEKEGIPRDRLIPGALVFTFPTPEQARAVADAICCPAPSAPAEVEGLVEPHSEQIEVWADELMSDLAMRDLLTVNDYDDKISALREIREKLTLCAAHRDDALTALQAENSRLTAELAETREKNGAMIERAAKACESVAYSGKYPPLDDIGELAALRCRDEIRALDPDATAALAARDKRVREEETRACIAELRKRRELLNSQTVILNIESDDAIYGICIDALTARLGQPKAESGE